MPGVETVGKKNTENDELIDFEDAEYQRQLLRPVEIKEDVKLMEQRQRVSRILHSDAFHRELNKILDHQLQEGAVCGGLAGSANESSAAAALQEISNLLLPQARLGCSVFNRGATMPIIPINNLRSSDTNVSKQEKFLRCKLAAVYRLIDLHGFASGMMLHASVRVNRDSNTFLVNCHGLMNHEITARNLVKVNLDGEVEGHSIIDQSSWLLHAAIHKSDTSMRCVIHIKTPSVVAVSCMKFGLLAICDEAVRLGHIPMYEWGSSSVNTNGNERLAIEQEALGHCLKNSHCILVRNQGLLVRGKTIEEAWRIVGLAVHACEIQIRLATISGSDNLIISTDKNESQLFDDLEPDLHFESLMRALDAAGHHTGYLYRHSPITVDRKRRIHQQTDDGHMADMEDEDEDVEIPPSATSFSGRVDSGGDEVTKKKGGQTQWHYHIPNDYVREETEEPGSRTSRKVVSWRQVSPDKRQTSGMVEMSTSPNQFAPQGHDPNELKHQQQKVKAKYFRDETSAGHQSRILRSMDASVSVPVDPVEEDVSSRVVLVGAVSRGIIDKQHRHDPSVYQSCFSPNPFDRVTDEDLQQYQKRIDRLNLGLPPDDEEKKSDIIVVTEDERAGQLSIKTATEAACSLPVTVSDHVIDSEIVPSTVHLDQQSPDIVGMCMPMHGHESGAATGGALSPGRAENIRSDTSGADMSHDDTEREGQKSASAVPGKKKKKKLKEMFSFRKKDKGK